MTIPTLHVIALNIPWPANYGGIIDIYYKIKALHDCGIQIVLHTFEYERPRAVELETICTEVHYYPRRTGIGANLTALPYNVYGRKAPRLIERLLADRHPILFEGLHSCYYLNDPRLANRFKIFRESNIEHDYYREIGKAEQHLIKKAFYYLEAARFERFQQRVAGAADLMLAVSTTDAEALRAAFPHNRIEFMPCFHENERITAYPGQSDFLLYHAKLSVKENEKAALYLIRHIFSRLPYRCIIAGMNPPASLYKAASLSPNIIIEANPTTERMHTLIREAHINLLVTFQATGLKLKLLNSLFAGRHTVVNPAMLAGSGLETLCHIAPDADSMVSICHELMRRPFTDTDARRRAEILIPAFSNRHQAERLVKWINEAIRPA